MPNQLSIPFKQTYTIPLRDTVKEYITKNHIDIHPDSLKWDIKRWDELRKDGVGGVVHSSRVSSMLLYHAQLVFILTKLPIDIGLEIPYAPAFNASGLPITLTNLVYERAAVLFNLAALYSQLAAAEDRGTKDGLKLAISSYQLAAGTLNFLISSVLPKLRSSVPSADFPLEFSEAFLRHLERLMLAQAQECVWQRGILDGLKNGVIAKLAKGVSVLYQDSLTDLRVASLSFRSLLPSGWAAHVETKQYHFEAAYQYRKSVDDLEANRYGQEISRLSEAQRLSKRAYDIARKGGVNPAVLQDARSLMETVQKSIVRAERDNDFIYHEDVPPPTALPIIQEALMVKSQVSAGLIEPKTVIGNDAVIFGEILAWGAKTAIDIYNDRRQHWITEEVSKYAQRLDDTAVETLRSLNLPSALEALEKPIGLPPSLLKKIDEVRLDNGPSKIEMSIEDVSRLAQQTMDTLDQAMDILDQEAEEDESFQARIAAQRPPSQDVNQHLLRKEARYREILEKAADSDEVVRGKWDEWESNIAQLAWNDADIEAIVPSSTFAGSSTKSNPTRIHARALRVLLESLDDLQRARRDQVNRATRLAEADDITPKIQRAAAGFEQWVEVQPAMLEDVIEDEMAKYEKFKLAIEEGDEKQQGLLDQIQSRNELFLQSRRDDAIVKEREFALQSLDLAYHKYKEIVRNLDEGLKFYNDLANMLKQFKESCREWANMRSSEIHSLVQSLESLSLRKGSDTDLSPGGSSQTRAPPAKPSITPSRSREIGQPAFDLPPPDSDEWETGILPPPPSRKPPMAAKGTRMR